MHGSITRTAQADLVVQDGVVVKNRFGTIGRELPMTHGTHYFEMVSDGSPASILHLKLTQITGGRSDCEIQLKGHLSEAIERAQEVFKVLLGDRRWRVRSVEYRAPDDDDLASNGVIQIMARQI